jgi:hypothetical protein
MFQEKISDYFEGVTAKYLSVVDAEPGRSNQHEIGGLVKAGFGEFLGRPDKGTTLHFRARMVYIRDNDSEPLTVDDTMSWYDSRHADRSPEYRLYYKSNEVTEQIAAGDFLLVGKLHDGSLFLVFTPPGSTVELQLRAIFGITAVSKMFKPTTLADGNILLPLQLVLEDLGIVRHADGGADDEAWLERIFSRFGDAGFPTTLEFSAFSRETADTAFESNIRPDEVLLVWMAHEERLFRLLERHLVKHRLQAGFGADGDAVDAFIDFSLSVQNRRKSRVGRAFENHLSLIFHENGLRFEQGGGKRATENHAKPDFLFPGFREYASMAFPASSLRLLGAKTTCKDRWRQVLSEGGRVELKHLITLEAAISETQTDEMRASSLQLVVPSEIQATYSLPQQQWLMSLSDFIVETRELQQRL